MTERRRWALAHKPEGQLTAVDGIVAQEDDESFDIALREQHWRRDRGLSWE